MKKLTATLAGLAAAGILAFGASPAQARSSWHVGINTGPYYYPAPAYYGAPVYYGPQYHSYYRYYAPPPCYYPAPVFGGISFGYHHR
jgi:hypothetical protein